ncbi:putative transporter YoaV [Thalassobacillus devorans]|uniref:Transporter YoaV n=1 Tax=Thalassobacillus devorans TaxID=279813 RepID=A0ABQ1NQX8_9BACI|nr:DMT family transporter [Thalassobacillus devorans]NIK28867.1 drug/metabolite transporter (DMT)-like permease [Thalassobacillus devorans]GGC82991.1 putative transporter YoaV [Thalassobacillus devorans]
MLRKIEESSSSIHNKKFLLAILILLVTLIWGYAWVLMKASLAFMGPFTFSALRFSTGTVTMFVILFVLKLGLPPKDQWKHLAVIGLLQTTVVFLFVMYGLKFVDAGKSSVLLYSMPIWSSLLASIFLSEKIPKVKGIGLALGMTGLLTILGWDVIVQQDLTVLAGELLIILAAVSWGISNVYYRKKLKNVTNLQVSAYQMLFGSLGLIIAALITEWGDAVHLTTESLYYVLFTGVLASALCFTLWFVILNSIDMVTATLSTLLVPVFGMIFGAVLLNEKLGINVILGSAMILTGIAVSQLYKRKTSPS